MFKNIVLILSAIIGVSLGFTLGPYLWASLRLQHAFLANPYLNALIFTLLFLLLGLLCAPLIERSVKRIIAFIEKQHTTRLIIGSVGLLLGILIGNVVTIPIVNLNIPFISNTLPLISAIIFALVGYQFLTSHEKEIMNFFHRLMNRSSSTPEHPQSEMLERKAGGNFHRYKLLDTSVIIDGRIADIVKTNFLEGILVIPNFVLHELQLIADSSDSLKRSKGRRGLDILNELQKNDEVAIEYYEGDFEDISEVDSKLVRLAKLMDAVIITNDYNLNKVSEFQNITVFNINELANAVKPVLIPGEELTVTIIKRGTERKQGIAYLDDGTMIVVEDGQYYMNERIPVIVTSAIQTNAGRMIFSKVAHGRLENTTTN